MTAQRRKVLFLIPSLEGGGAERVFSMLLRHLDRSRFEPHLAVLQAEGAYLRDIPQDVVVHNLNISRVRYALPRVVRLVWKVRPRTLLSTLRHLNLALILAKPFLPRGTRLLVREAAIVSTVLREERTHPRLWAWLYRHLYGRADAVVCLSDSMVEDLVVNFSLPREKLVRIYNPVDIERVRQLGGVGENPYASAGPHLVAAGRLCRQKGFDVLLEAMPTVLKNLPGAQLAILGEGPLQSDLTEQAQRLGLNDKVRFLGFQQNPWPWLKHADLFVLPSRYEGLPNALLEALALGTPVVASDCPGGIREVQNCDGGIAVVPMEDPDALALAIITVGRRSGFSAGRETTDHRILNRFDLQQIVGEYSKLF